MQIAESFSRVALATFLVLSASGTSSADDDVDFNRDIRPLLSDRCFHCHGPDATTREADLRLDVPPAKDGPQVVVPMNAAKSELLRRVASNDPDERMPPPKSGKPLNDDEIQLLTKWIEQGADWTTHWAYVPPVRHEAPAIKDKDWPKNWIDYFIAHRLDAGKLGPSADADRITLIRRLSFDLTGLPPTPVEVVAFVKDTSPNAVENLIDRLLDTDAYGERMTVYWLDLVRYADTVGYHGDQTHAISPYRDWVIDAFAANMRFDQFTREQLAGDLLPDSDIDQKIATGYNRLLQTSHEGGVQAKEYLAMYSADRVRNVSAVWLGGTLGCAQCHDHKYDPYTTRDFYSMAAFFADVDEAEHLRRGDNALPTKRSPELVVLAKRERERLKKLDEQIAAAEKSAAEEGKAQLADLRKQRKALADSGRRTMITKAIKPRDIRVLPRGDWLDESGPIVQPAIPDFLGAVDVGDDRATRLDLANWMTDSKNGSGLLTARVMVNRFWYLLFGEGLTPSIDDFGGQGQPPKHPELLDRLAWEFVESGWNVKHMMKLIASSRTYQQSSLVSDQLRKRDSANHLFARQNRFRLPAEMVRDNALAVSALLVRDIGGPSVKPYQPVGYYRHLNFPTRKYTHDTNTRQWRRGLYVHWQRQFLHPMLKAFDAPRREECAARRPQSNTPLASLSLLNDPTFVEAARAFASRLLKQADSDERRLDLAYKLAVSRGPDEFETNTLLRLLTDARKQFNESETSAKKLTQTGLSKVDPDQPAAELAAWTTIARVLLNLSETMTRN